ncbi:uncharacterized protein H6S33_002381 [Morchella sextelata]|uniref:uncharacterized protein n=1 Tax=Morchella sextelata TaxID=1174677 RepID=UPI001D04CB5A|nr:uncharacterized protein H6S33_002381 [Morchella sextelata]KAH0607347.1 hypothetical protein H6S33_002381 [Morchella sextelata]
MFSRKSVSGHDRRLAREWRDRQNVLPAGVVIKNSFNHSKIDLNTAPVNTLAGFVKRTSGALRAARGKTGGRKRKRNAEVEPVSIMQTSPGGYTPPYTFPYTVNLQLSLPVLNPAISSHQDLPSSCFTDYHQTMRTTHKWLLPSGKHLEDILYDNYKDSVVVLAVHSCVVDTGDTSVESCFNDEDWKAICEQVTPLPEADRVLVESMRRFMGLQDAANLREAVYSTSFLKSGEAFDADKHQGPAWVDLVMRSFLDLYENPTLFDKYDNSENWYTVYIWSSLFDRSMPTLPGSRISRGESASTSAAERKNRDPTKRKRPGHLYGGVLHIDYHEAGVMEHSKCFITETPRKWVADRLKVVKVLHDMLYDLETRVNNNPEILRLLPVVGLVSAVPTMVADYEPLFAILVSFWRHRTLMHGFKAIVTCRAATSEDLVARLMNAGSGVLKREHVLPSSVETDGE